MLRVVNISYGIGGRTLFESASCHIPSGHRVGLVGANGTGKTTLLRLILKEAELDGGDITIQSHARVGIVAQDAPGGETTPLDATLQADEELTSLTLEAKTATDATRIAEIHGRLQEIDADAAPSRAAAILAGLGFSEADQHRPLKHFSGGWRMRVALAAVLFSKPDLLLLDEPTNHLDLEAATWLMNHLKHYPNTLLMVSHDRNLLSNTVNAILHLQEGKLEIYQGGYGDFMRIRAERFARIEALRTKQAAARKRMEDFVNRFRAKATKARQAQSRLKMLSKMAPVVPLAKNRTVTFQFPNPSPCSSPLLRLDEASVAYTPGEPVLRDLHLSIYEGDRVALLGQNGNGKTTLARLLAGELSCDSGTLFRSAKLNVGYFAQDHLDLLDPMQTSLEQVRQIMPDASMSEVRGWLGRFGLGEDKAEVPVAHISGGEKTRLTLALAVRNRPNLLILDEPTNHLDIDSREALIEALNAYPGTVVLVSHDRHLLEASADQLWLVHNGTATAFFGDLDDYVKVLENTRKGPSKEAQTDGDEKQSKKQQRQEAAKIRAKLAPLKKAVEQAVAEVETLQQEKGAVDARLADPATYEKDVDQVPTLTKKQRMLETRLEAAEEAWMAAEAALEELTQSIEELENV